MNTLWGPALEAETAYRREQLRVSGPRRRSSWRVQRRARATVARERRTARGWAMPGSEAWPAAR